MTYNEIYQQIKKKRSFLCVGLDTDLSKIPPHLKEFDDPLFEFNRQIVEATVPYAIAYKPNLAFYEAYGTSGWQSLEKTVKYIKSRYPEVFLIADAKRGDIGNTAQMYARAFFENLPFDAVTLSPYMGSDTVLPFLEYKGKWVILLALTSNASAGDFQTMKEEATGLKLYEKVFLYAQKWGSIDNTMFVVGATKAQMLRDIRNVIPNHFLLVPGVGTQGGNLEEVSQNALTSQCGLIVNVSRDIIFASQDSDFANAAGERSQYYQSIMGKILDTYIR